MLSMSRNSCICVSDYLKQTSEIDKKVMPRKFVSRIMPPPELIAHLRRWGWVGRQLFADDLWHLNRRSVALAFLNGLFWACMPMPLQMVAAAIFALILRCNVPLSVGLVWLTNPITMPPYYFFAYQLGSWVLGTEGVSWPEEVTLDWIQNQLNLIWWPLLTGSLIVGAVLSILGFFVIRIWWRVQVSYNWRRRSGRFLKQPATDCDVTQAADLSEPQPGDRESQ